MSHVRRQPRHEGIAFRIAVIRKEADRLVYRQRLTAANGIAVRQGDRRQLQIVVHDVASTRSLWAPPAKASGKPI